jgi:hypothetical protein
MSASPELLRAVAVTAELCNTVLSEAAATVLSEDLAGYPEHQVVGALKRCRRELRGRQALTLGEILLRLDDGRPGPEEAWAAVSQTANNEDITLVWTQEMSEAFGVALPLMNAGELIPARMAFKEAYIAKVQIARDERTAPRWTVSPGRDANGREAVLIEAVEKGRLTAESVAGLLAGVNAGQASPRILELIGKAKERLLLTSGTRDIDQVKGGADV